MDDGRGGRLTLPTPPRHIVSLAPNLTEILYTLGVQDRLVLDTTSCDYPPAAKAKPHIDIFNASVETIIVQNPDLIIAQDRQDDRMIAAARKVHLPTLVVKADTVQDVFDAIQTIGQATGADRKAALEIARLHSAISHVRDAVLNAQPRPKILLMWGTKPIYTTGPNSFINDLIGIAGGANIVDGPPNGDVISSELVLSLRPDIIICSPSIAAQARQLPGWADGVPAVHANHFYTPDDGLVRPGPRMAEAAEHLARYLHPDRFPTVPAVARH